jgi:hypothetical protein
MFQARGYQSWASDARDGKLTPATSMFWGGKPAEELYDMSADPDSVHNHAADPAHRETLDGMRAALKRRVLANKDNGFLPEGSVLEGYDASRVPGAYPIERVFALATLAAERNADNLPKLIKSLDDPSEPVRWWAAQGCTLLRDKSVTAEPALRKCLKDKSGAVQIAAAEALASLGKPELAMPVLLRRVRQSAKPPFALQAANVLDRLGEAARPALPALKSVLADARKPPAKEDAYPVRILTHIIDVLEGREQPLVYPAVP